MRPYYEHAGITIYHGDMRDCRAWIDGDVLITDPPYGINYESGHHGSLPRSIHGDENTGARDLAIHMWTNPRPRPAIVFGTWKSPRPDSLRGLLVWDTGGALGMGDLAFPWKPSHQEIYIIGHGFHGRREGDVLRFAPVQSMAANGRVHPHEKPLALIKYLIDRSPSGAISDPFMGSGTTLVAAKQLGRKAVGVEVNEAYCEIAAKRLSQEVLF